MFTRATSIISTIFLTTFQILAFFVVSKSRFCICVYTSSNWCDVCWLFHWWINKKVWFQKKESFLLTDSSLLRIAPQVIFCSSKSEKEISFKESRSSDCIQEFYWGENLPSLSHFWLGKTYLYAMLFIFWTFTDTGWNMEYDM